MERTYENDVVKDDVIFFTGVEVEKTPAYLQKTLFVTGTQSLDDILNHVKNEKCTHVYLGANQSFEVSLQTPYNEEEIEEIERWENLTQGILDAGYWVTLDFDVKYVDVILEMGLDVETKFIPMVSVKLPYINQLGYNATLKVDDIDFEATNPGVWCHSVHELQDREKFTSWAEYTQDKPLT